MAQTGFTPIKIYSSSTAAAVPLAANLAPGELAINTADGKLFYEDSAGVVQVIGTKGGVGSSSTTQVLYNNAGTLAGSANLTFDGTILSTGQIRQSSNKVALGLNAGITNQGSFATALGNLAGQTNQGGWGIAIGSEAGNTGQGLYSIAIGRLAAYSSQGADAIAIGRNSGSNQGTFGVAIGNGAGGTGAYAVAIGNQSGAVGAGASSVAIGDQAGYAGSQGYSISIGYKAGYSSLSSATNAIILNATGAELSGVVNQSNSFYVAPIRANSASTTNAMFYDTTTKEVTTANLATYLASPPAIGGTAAAAGAFTALSASASIVLNTTPKTWTSGYYAMELATGNLATSTNGTLYLNQNSYNSGSQYIAISTAAASRYAMNSGLHLWYNAASVSAGNPLTFVQAMTLDLNSNLLLGTTSATTPATTSSLSVANTFGFKNRIINGAFNVLQYSGVGISSGVGNSSAYMCDRWIGMSSGATPTFTSAVASTTLPTSSVPQNALTITQSPSSGGSLAIAQRIESINVADLHNQTVAVQLYAATSTSTTVSWTAYYANTANTWQAVGASNNITTGATAIAAGSFTTTASLALKTFTFALGTNAATNGLMIVFDITAGVSVTFTVTGLQLEKGAANTAFDYRPYTTELTLASRYFGQYGTVVGTSTFTNPIVPRTAMRVTPTVSAVSVPSGTGAAYSFSTYGAATGFGVAYQSTAHSVTTQAVFTLNSEL